MNDDEIKTLFARFSPELSDDSRFMDRLTDRLKAVEMVRQHNAMYGRINRLAVFIAALAGFVVGAVCMAFLPEIKSLIYGLELWSVLKVHDLIDVFAPVAVWLIIAAVSLVVAFNAYVLSTSVMGQRRLAVKHCDL